LRNAAVDKSEGKKPFGRPRRKWDLLGWDGIWAGEGPVKGLY
jgi:hypothetical protein